MKELKAIVVDTTCLIGLENIGGIHILMELFDTVIVPSSVKVEFEKPGLTLPGEFTVLMAKQGLDLGLGKGETEVIGLALEMGGVLAALDDLKARNVALRLGIRTVGVLGLLVKVKKAGIIELVEPAINEMRQSNFRVSNELYAKVLELANEGKRSY